MTQSDTYSSRPWRVSEPSPRSPVITAVTPLSLRKRNRRRSSERRSAWLVKPPKSDSMVSSTALRAHRVDGERKPDEQALQIVFADFFDLLRLDAHVVERELLLLDEGVQIEAERAHVLGKLLAGLLEADERTWLVELGGAANQEFGREQRLAAARAAADERRPALGRPPPVISSRP